ncbi:helix-turn-helix domain-containing protein [Paractinoplanes rhizophilus]|uniref:Helix-turn-helix domain-containing protein n=1 Tax=Paractinoplanes rhizophilus TaxID=1416877 RepID=A0ABW2I519_9ACTN|nr:XRE family transcriptional regulator [Actinoplanes sp.]
MTEGAEADSLTVSAQNFAAEMTRLGRILRAARGDRFSLETLAERSGVSAGLLSQIERGIGNPSFQTLLRVAGALGISLVELVDSSNSEHAPDHYVVRRHERRTMAWPLEQISFELLTPRGQREVNVLRSVLPPHSRVQGFYDPQYYRGTVCLYVQRESVAVGMADGSRVLHAGDTLTCRSEQISTVGNPGAVAAELLTITTPGGL